MIQVIVKKQNDDMVGFHIEGHSGYADRGADIVCSAVSALAINCVNSIEEFTEDLFSVGSDEERGMLDFELTDSVSPESALLLKSLFFGIKEIETSYGSQYVKLINR
jgi:hypothetical protein